MNESNRRDFLRLSTSIGLAALVPDTFAATVKEPHAVNTALPSAFAANHELQPLPFNPAKLDGLSEKLIHSHWENNYGASVKALNAVKQKLATWQTDASIPASIYNNLKREHLLRTGSLVLHELYFANLGGTGQPDATLNVALAEAFGSRGAWELEFKRMGQGLGGGSGWVTLGYNVHSGLLENYWHWDHLHAPAATLPVLVMDMYEHAYQMDYGADAAHYIEAFLRNIHWATVARRLSQARQVRSLLLAGGWR